MIPTQRADADDPQDGETTTTAPIKYQVQDQLAEWHLGLDDDALIDMAVRAVQPEAKS